MPFFGFLGVSIPLVVIGVITFFIIAIVQEGKGEHKGAIKTAFFSMVSLVMLAIVVATTMFLGQMALKQWVFTNAPDPSRYSLTQPPMPEAYIASKSDGSPNAINYTCKDGCQFSSAEKDGLRSWLSAYSSWRSSGANTLSAVRKREAINALSFLIVALPLYWFFFRTLQREAKRDREVGKNKPGPLRSVYFYLVAFAGLVVVVVSAALLVNLGLRTAFHLGGSTSSTMMLGYPSPVQSAYVDSIAACADTCGFSADEVQLARDWKNDSTSVQKLQQQEGASPAQSDLTTNIPLMLVGLPLFWFHFAAIRRETKDAKPEPTPTATV